MATIQLELDPVALREATSQAIMGILTPEIKTKMIERSILALLTASTDSWDKGKTPLQKAFDSAVERVTNELAMEQIKNDATIKTQLEELLRKTADAVLNIDQIKMAEKLAHAWCEGLKASGNSRY